MRAGSRAPLVLLAAAALAFLGAAMPWSPGAAFAGDGTCGEASAQGSTTWYFAEGYTGDGFQEYLCLFNPGDRAVGLELHLLFNAQPPQKAELDLPPLARLTLDINAYAGKDREVSLYLEAESPIVAERPMYFTYRGAWKGCTVTGGAESPSGTWYFAEGCTRAGFETWLLLANPGDVAAKADVCFILEDGGINRAEVGLPPHSRRTLFANDMLGEGHDASARVEADAPVCAERVMYFQYHGAWPGGHASSGLSAARSTYFFAEGYTGAGFEEWLTLYAPREHAGADGTDVSVNCLFQDGEERSSGIHLDPDRRYTLDLNQLVGADRNVSLELTAGEPFLAERPMYFNFRGVCRGGHVSKGVGAPGTHWYLAEGTVRGGFRTFLCLMNPGHAESEVEIDCFFGQEKSSEKRVLPPRSRLTIEVKEPSSPATAKEGVAGASRSPDMSFEISSSRPICVERPLYFPGTAFEVANAMDTIRHLSAAIGPRVEGTAGEAAAAAYLADTLRSYGYAPVIQEVPLPNGGITRNVIAGLTPAASPGDIRILFVGAHYDTKIRTGSPGANDNASGTATVLELARCMAEEPPRGGIAMRFLFFGGEERLVEGSDLHHFGSRHYVNSLSQGEKQQAMGAIIVDMVGVGSQLYARSMGVGPVDLCNRLMAYARETGVYLPYLVSGSYSDHEPFEAAGIPAVWLGVKDDPWYHTPGDSYDKINPAHIENAGRLLEGFLRTGI